MNTANEISGQLIKHIKKQGWQVTIVSIASVNDLETEIGARRQKGLLDPVLFDEYLASFDFACARRLADAQSLIIVGVPQPQDEVRVEGVDGVLGRVVDVFISLPPLLIVLVIRSHMDDAGCLRPVIAREDD